MKHFILAATLMFTMAVAAFSGGDVTAIAPTSTTKREADKLRPTPPLVAVINFDDSIFADTIYHVVKLKQK
jgi:hypothetical protein